MFGQILKYKVHILLVLIFLLGGILRFYKISNVPVSLYWDEVSSTYNAYSVLKTGNDEFGNPHPLLFRAFEDYKTPANIYLTALPVAFFGVSEFSARFTSAILGTLTIILTFFLMREILDRKKFLEIDGDYIALFSTFLMAISPWSIQFSRTGFEANVGLSFVVLGGLFFFRFIRERNLPNLPISAISFAASIYFYRSIWVFVPLLIIGLSVIHRKSIFSKQNLKISLISLGFFVITVAPFAPTMISRQGLIRASQVNVIDNSADQVNKYIAEQSHLKGQLSKIVFNRRIAYGQTIVQGYFRHFSLNYLFIQGDPNPRHGVKGFGVFYLWMIIFIIPGIYALLKLDKKTRVSILVWVLLAPIPAALSVPTPHALRSLNMLPMPQIIAALGASLIFSRLRSKPLRFIFGGILVAIVLFFFTRYLYSYYGPSAIITSSSWGDGYKQLTQYVFKNENKYDKIVISGHYWQPYIYFLFYKRYDPMEFQKFDSKQGFYKYLFGGTSWDMNGKELGDIDLVRYAGTRNILVALSPVEYEKQKQNINVATEIRNHNNELVFIVGTPK